MNLVNLETEAAALGGYVIGSTGQDATNKSRAARRINVIKADIISRYGGKWDANYREGWLALTPLYNTGTATFTNGSRSVTGINTVWTSSMKGSKILGPDACYYRVASVTNGTTLILSQLYQGATATGDYLIWKDEYTLAPEVLTLGGFVDYIGQEVVPESWPRNMKESYPKSASANNPTRYNVVGRERYSATYSTGTVSGTINTNVLTGNGTAWLANIEPGYEVVIGSYTYHVLRVNSDIEIELYQQLVVAPSSASYSAKGKNALKVRFAYPTTQQVVHYWYWAKDYPLVNDSDEDWVTESYPKVVINGMTYYDYIDKNDPVRADRASIGYENSIKDMKVSLDGAFTGVRTLGLDVPDVARD